ncbi:putative ribonuclease H-like domain-containing protein [Tanacetum coccineum]
MNVSPIPTTRIQKDHPKEHIIRDINSATQTRRMVFAPVARFEAIRLFLAYASFMGFIVYQMDVKSAFLYGTIEEEVYVYQPPGFEDPEFPNKVIEQVAVRSGMDSKMAELTMSSPNRSTSDIEDAFSSMNILNYTSVSPDYFPASSGSSSFNSSENSIDNMIPPVFSSFYNNPCLKDVQAFYAKESPISSPDPITSPAILTPSPILPPSLLFNPQYFFIPEELLPPKKRIYELYLHRIERMEEGRINGNELKTELKKIRTQIIKLQKKQLGQKDKIAFPYYRNSDLELLFRS